MTRAPRLTRRRALGLAGALGLGTVGVATGVGSPFSDGAGPAPGVPWAGRPRVALAVDVADDLRSVAGHEHIRFTPDAAVSEIVLRAWPNRPSGARGGSSLVVTDARVAGVPVRPAVAAGGAPAGSPGTLVELPLPRAVPAGETVEIDLDYRLELGEEPDERFGTSPDSRTAWFASAHPMLAWVRGEGWVRDDAVDLAGETTTSEDVELTALDVTAPSGLAVAGVGPGATRRPGPREGTTTHRFSADAVRDVAVAVGRFDVLHRTLPGDVRLHLLTPASGTEAGPDEWTDTFIEVLPPLTALLGPLPYRDLWATVVPSQSSGIEFPGALQFGDVEPSSLTPLVAHELGHQWFYGLVGSNQARDPWLDESFATFAEAIVTEESGFALDDVDDRVVGDLGDPMARWASRGGFGLYYEGVYRQGAAVLLEARRRVGADAFDDALRGYLAAGAHRVVGPAAVAAAFADLPEVVDLLAAHGAPLTEGSP